MPREMFGTIGTSTTDQLLYDFYGADKIPIACLPGNGVIKRGTVVVKDTTGMWKPAESADIVNTKMFAITDEEVDTGEAANGVAEEINAYRAGCFIDGRPTLKADAPLTAAHKVVLLRQGISFGRKTETAEFNNFVE